MNISKCYYLLTIITLLLVNTSVSAANLYRFKDQYGVMTMSKSLPPYAAQKGYDILDANSLRLLERVAPALTPEQILQKEAEAQKQREQQRREAEALEKQKQQIHQQNIIDQNLIARFSSEQELLEARDKELYYYQIQLEKAQEDLADNQSRLRNLQKKAGQQELSGQGIDNKLKNQLLQLQDDVATNKRNIERIQQETSDTKKTYAEGLIRLRYLLSRKEN